MARSVDECNSYILANLTTQFASVGITINTSLWSRRNFLRLCCYTIAIAQAFFEQMWDLAQAKMQAIADNTPSATAQWIQSMMFKFQYDATNVQNVTTVNGVSSYPVVNSSYQIIKACAVSSTISNVVNIKVAKGSPLQGLSSLEKAAAQSYIGQIGVIGINYNVISMNPDKIRIAATIYFKGIYSAVILNNVKTAINNYLTNLSVTRFGGDILMSELADIIREVEGVNDVVFSRVSCRLDSQGILTGIDMVNGGTFLNRKYTSGAGYIVEETTAGNTFTDTLTFIAE